MASLLNHVPAMKIRFWGVRGSIASPGHDTAAVGGNTSCVELACGDTRIVLDAGTGLRALGNHLVASGATREPLALTLLLSHYHWDHIQGLPFFVPVYMKDTSLTIVGGQNGVGSVRETLERQMCAPVFPVRLDEVGARITTREVRLGEVFDVGAATVRVARGNHPGGVVAYRGSTRARASSTRRTPSTTPASIRRSARSRRAPTSSSTTRSTLPTSTRARSAGGTPRTWPARSSRARRAWGRSSSSITIRCARTRASPASKPRRGRSSARASRRARGWSWICGRAGPGESRRERGPTRAVLDAVHLRARPRRARALVAQGRDKRRAPARQRRYLREARAPP